MRQCRCIAYALYCLVPGSLSALAVAQTTNDAVLRGPSFAAGTTFAGSGTGGWHTLDGAQWSATAGVITGKATSAPAWLVLDQAYQDPGCYSAFRCDGDCETGILLRLSKIDGGMRGTFISIRNGAVEADKVALNSDGEITSRDKLRNAGGTIRFAPAPSDSNNVL